jgi:hypothetical protein
LQSNGYGGDDDERFMKFIASQMALGGFFQSNSFKFDIKSTEHVNLIKFTAKLVQSVLFLDTKFQVEVPSGCVRNDVERNRIKCHCRRK